MRPFKTTMASSDYSGYTHFLVTQPSPFVAHVTINRPSKYNSFIESMWIEYGRVFDQLSVDKDVRVIILSGAGDKAFTTGLDVQAAAKDMAEKVGDPARVARGIIRNAGVFQNCIGAAERCEKRK